MPDGADPASESPPPAAPPAEPPAEDWERRFTYLYADFENYRRRATREREATRRASQAEVLRGVLPLVEATEQAVEAVQKLPPKDPIRRGVEMLEKAFGDFLSERGVRVVGTVGEPFDPEEHEAVGESAAGPKTPDGAIVTIVQQGYVFEGGLLRPAKVIVARRPAEPAAAATAAAPESPGHEDADDAE